MVGAFRWAPVAAMAMLLAATPVAAQFPAEVAGMVLDATTRAPLERARIRVTLSGLLVETDAAGRFRLRGLPPGEWELEIAAIGYRPARERVTLTDGRVEPVSILLAPSPVELAPLEVAATPPATGPGVSVISRDQIDAAHAPDLPALLATEPGVTVTQQGGAGAPATVSIRGSAAHQVLVLLDGVPVNDPTTGTVDLSTIPVEQLERITIVRGAAASRYGPRALAGVIAIERRRPTATEAWATFGAGAYGERTARGGISGAGQRGDRLLAGSLSGGLTRFDGDFVYAVPAIRGGGSASRANGDGATESLLGSLRYGSPRSFAELRGDYLHVRRGLPGSIVQATRRARQAERRLGSGITAHQALGPLLLRADVEASEGRVQYADPAPPTTPAYDDSLRVRQLQASLEGVTTLGRVRLSLGAERRWLGIRASNLVSAAPATQRVSSGWLLSSIEGRVAGLRPSLSVGARVDRDDRLGDSHWSPSLGLTLPLPVATLQFSWSTAYAPPALADQFFQPGVLAQPNPDLQPERVRHDWQVQLNANPVHLGWGTLSGSAAVYRADVDGMILWFPDFRFVWSPGNYDVRRQGAELGAVLALPVAGLSLSANVSDASVAYRGPVLSGQVAYRPRTTANASLSAVLAEFRAQVRYRYIGERRTVPGSQLNTLAPFGVADLQVSRRLPLMPARAELTVGVDDLFDRAGTMLIDYPSAGRTWRLTLSVRAGTSHSTPALHP